MRRSARVFATLLASACGDDVPAGGQAASTGEHSGDTSPTTIGDSSDPATDASTSAASDATDSETSAADTTEGDGSSTGPAPVEYEWDLPEGFPVPRVPEDNPMSVEKAELGRYLFYDTRLSANEAQSCASCHDQALAFAESIPLSIGSTGDVVPRNAMSLANVAYSASQTWANPLLEHLSDQAAVPLFGEDPIELGAIFADEEILQRLADDSEYPARFEAAYPSDPDPISWINIRRAIASFERTLLSGNAPYDEFQRGDEDAISESAQRGANLFFSEALECHHCHNGFNFTNSTVHEGTVFDSKPFFNTGLYNIDGNGAYPPSSWGLAEFTLEAADMGKFKPPTLRNVALTAPYMHDGSIATLDEVLDHYAAGGREIIGGPFAGNGALNPHKSAFVSGFDLSEQDRADLLAFLESLTDAQFIDDPRFADPFAEGH